MGSEDVTLTFCIFLLRVLILKFRTSDFHRFCREKLDYWRMMWGLHRWQVKINKLLCYYYTTFWAVCLIIIPCNSSLLFISHPLSEQQGACFKFHFWWNCSSSIGSISSCDHLLFKHRHWLMLFFTFVYETLFQVTPGDPAIVITTATFALQSSMRKWKWKTESRGRGRSE